MGKYLSRKHNVSRELIPDLRARACAMRAEHASVREIAKALGVSRSCAHRWVRDAPEHGAATARNGGVRVYPPGTRRFVSKLWRAGYSRDQRIAMMRELAAVGVLDTADDVTERVTRDPSHSPISELPG